MRVCIQKLLPLLKQDGSYLNDYTSSLVRKGMEVEIQQAMEVLQVLLAPRKFQPHFGRHRLEPLAFTICFSPSSFAIQD